MLSVKIGSEILIKKRQQKGDDSKINKIFY